MVVDKVGLLLHTAAGPGPLLFLSALFVFSALKAWRRFCPLVRWLELPLKSFLICVYMYGEPNLCFFVFEHPQDSRRREDVDPPA